ncbi:MAG: heavy metal-responsive transcriptional regulator [Chloroflexi bacterium]|nr:MAG: heavy metal-responsive transcriptional regulator [Chloroflexota bacterium]
MDTLTIGQLAGCAGVNLETIRYYERRGLLPEPPRRASGYRAYPPESLARIRFIKSAQALGFTLEEIHHLLSLRVHAGTSCEQVRQQAEQKLAEVTQKIQALQELQQALVTLTEACAQGGPQGECPILEALEERAS